MDSGVHGSRFSLSGGEEISPALPRARALGAVARSTSRWGAGSEPAPQTRGGSSKVLFLPPASALPRDASCSGFCWAVPRTLTHVNPGSRGHVAELTCVLFLEAPGAPPADRNVCWREAGSIAWEGWRQAEKELEGDTQNVQPQAPGVGGRSFLPPLLLGL